MQSRRSHPEKFARERGKRRSRRSGCQWRPLTPAKMVRDGSLAGAPWNPGGGQKTVRPGKLCPTW